MKKHLYIFLLLLIIGSSNILAKQNTDTVVMIFPHILKLFQIKDSINIYANYQKRISTQILIFNQFNQMKHILNCNDLNEPGHHAQSFPHHSVLLRQW